MPVDMQTPADHDLEKFIDAKLRELPELSAPPTLAPRVMARVRSRAEQRWWQRAWWNWPLTAKAAFAALCMCVLGTLTGGGIWLNDSVAAYSQQVSRQVAPLTSRMDALPQIAVFATGLQGYITQQHLLYGLALFAAVYLSCVGVGTMCYRISSKRF